MSARRFFRLQPSYGKEGRSGVDFTPRDYDAICPLLANSPSGEYSLPKKIDSKLWNSKYRVTEHARPRLVLQWCTCCLDFIVASSVATEFVKAAPKDLQILPVQLNWGKRIPKNAPEYWYVNIYRIVDCVNFVKTQVFSEDDPEVFRMKDYDEGFILDPSRIPEGVSVFHPRYLRDEVVISVSLAKVLKRIAPSAFDLVPIQFAKEAEQSRKTLLASLKKSANARMRAEMRKREFNSAESVSKELSVKLSKRAASHFKNSPEIDAEVEVFDGAMAVEETQRLRAWEELVWPKHLVCISEDGRGGYFALDLSKVKEGDCPVVYFDHELAEIDKKTGRITPQFEVAAKTFDAWVKRLRRGGSALA